MTEQIVWRSPDSIILTRGSEPFGELLNMTRGFPINWGKMWKSSEALYQAARFPDSEQIQEDIRASTNGFTAKLVAKANISHTRDDWDDIRVAVMRQVLEAKYTQHKKIREIIADTGTRDIVEQSKRDGFWGACQSDVARGWLGLNMLGQLWMDIRSGIPKQDERIYLPGASLDAFFI